MTRISSPRIDRFVVRAIRLPMREPHRTASGVITESPLVLTDVALDDGTVGHSLVFTYTPAALQPTAELVRNFEALVKGDPLAPAETERSNALDLVPGVFTFDDPRRIAESLKRSAERSRRRKAEPFASAMSMLTFYVNRAGSQLPAPRRRRLEQAKDELRALFGRPRRAPRRTRTT